MSGLDGSIRLNIEKIRVTMRKLDVLEDKMITMIYYTMKIPQYLKFFNEILDIAIISIDIARKYDYSFKKYLKEGLKL